VIEVADRVLVDGRDVSAEIRGPDVTAAVSAVSAHEGVRAVLVDHQRTWAEEHGGGVVEGRDIGTVVFPHTPVKVFLTASVEARAARRHKQLSEKGFPSNIAILLQDLRARDERDSSRLAAPLRPAEGARQLDSSDLSIEQVVSQILRWHGEG